jgi:hypothetical protein
MYPNARRKGVILRRFGECHTKEVCRLRATDFKQQAAADRYELWMGIGYHHSFFGSYFNRLPPCSSLEYPSIVS